MIMFTKLKFEREIRSMVVKYTGTTCPEFIKPWKLSMNPILLRMQVRKKTQSFATPFRMINLKLNIITRDFKLQDQHLLCWFQL